MKKIIRLIFPQKTKWIPFGNFNFSNYDYIVFARKNLKNGLLDFKTIRVNRHFIAANCVDNVVPFGLINVKEQWDKLINLK